MSNIETYSDISSRHCLGEECPLRKVKDYVRSTKNGMYEIRQYCSGFSELEMREPYDGVIDPEPKYDFFNAELDVTCHAGKRRSHLDNFCGHLIISQTLGGGSPSFLAPIYRWLKLL